MLITACSEDPTSPEININPKDGSWSGITSPEKAVTFEVMNNGSEIDSGFVITMPINEWWGYGYAVYTRTKSIEIDERTFSFDGSGISVQGEFENRTKGEGNFALSGNTGSPYYYAFNSTGIWTAEWGSSLKEESPDMNNSDLHKDLSEQIVEKQLNGSNKVVITYYLKY
jgi:hypothetical protein